MKLYEHVVRLGETDAAGRVYFVNPLNWYQAAFEELMLSQGQGIKSILNGSEIYPIVHVEVDYKAAIEVGEKIHVEITKAHIEGRKLIHEFSVFLSNNTLAVKGKVIHVRVEKK